MNNYKSGSIISLSIKVASFLGWFIVRSVCRQEKERVLYFVYGLRCPHRADGDYIEYVMAMNLIQSGRETRKFSQNRYIVSDERHLADEDLAYSTYTHKHAST